MRIGRSLGYKTLGFIRPYAHSLVCVTFFESVHNRVWTPRLFKVSAFQRRRPAIHSIWVGYCAEAAMRTFKIRSSHVLAS